MYWSALAGMGKPFPPAPSVLGAWSFCATFIVAHAAAFVSAWAVKIFPDREILTPIDLAATGSREARFGEPINHPARRGLFGSADLG